MATLISCGPSGGSGGDFFTDAISSVATVTEVRIRAGKVIDSVEFLQVGPEGAVFERHLHGGYGGTPYTFPVAGASIFEVSGRYGTVVDSVTITVKRPGTDAAGEYLESQRFGGDGGPAEFWYRAPPGYEIVGVCGRAGEALDAIGVVFRPLAERPA